MGSAAGAWPLVTRAQQPGRMRRIGVLFGSAESDPTSQSLIVSQTSRGWRRRWIGRVGQYSANIGRDLSAFHLRGPLEVEACRFVEV
jgi:hypothetical protein